MQGPGRDDLSLWPFPRMAWVAHNTAPSCFVPQSSNKNKVSILGPSEKAQGLDEVISFPSPSTGLGCRYCCPKGDPTSCSKMERNQISRSWSKEKAARLKYTNNFDDAVSRTIDFAEKCDTGRKVSLKPFRLSRIPCFGNHKNVDTILARDTSIKREHHQDSRLLDTEEFR